MFESGFDRLSMRFAGLTDTPRETSEEQEDGEQCSVGVHELNRTQPQESRMALRAIRLL